MASKVRAARMASAFGVPTVIGPGRERDIVGRILSGGRVGSLFVPRNARLSSRKAWIRFSSRSHGALTVDAGAEAAVRARGKSLLPKGITGVQGDFRAGEAVEIIGPSGVIFARGLTNYSSAELGRIIGALTERIPSMLGFSNGDEAVHRDDLVLVEDEEMRPE